MTASATRGTFSVDFNMIGVSISPSSFTWVDPASFPNALPIKIAPGTFSRNRFPPCGRIAVTPVRTLSPRMTLVCPTMTPPTSLIMLCGPVGRMPTTTPASRARGLAGAPTCAGSADILSALSASARTALSSDIAIDAAIMVKRTADAARNIFESRLRIRFNPDRVGRFGFAAQQRATEDIDRPALDRKRRKAQEAEYRHLENLDVSHVRNSVGPL